MTHKEIAGRLGISPAALSLILNGKRGISAETRQRVIQELEKMGLSHLLKQTTSATPDTIPEKKICFAIYKRSGYVVNQNPFVLLLMEHIESRAKEFGYNILIKTIDSSEPLAPQFNEINHMGAQGLLIMATEMHDDDLKQLSTLNIPCVAMDNDFTNDYINTVSINNQMGTYQAVEYLVRMGHTRIGYLQSSNWISSWGERAYGFRSALHRFGLELPEKYVYRIRYSEEASYQDFKQLIADGIDLPTALVTDDDVIAVGAQRALIEAGYSIPDDVSIIGYNNRPCCEIMMPQLSSIDVPKYAFSAKAVDALLRLIPHTSDGQLPFDDCVKERISTQLIVRSSVRDLHEK